MPDCAIGLMARYPEQGKVKTRLAEAVGNERALQVYRELLNTTAQLMRELDIRCFHRVAFVTPTETLVSFEKEYPGFDAVCVQSGGDLGERMMNALQLLLRRDGIDRAFLIGSDCPEISLETLDQACSALIENDLVLGPTLDGGYYLIGLKKIHPQLFTEIEWGSSKVFERTMAVAVGAGLRVARLQELRDLDNVNDLTHFTGQGILRCR